MNYADSYKHWTIINYDADWKFIVSTTTESEIIITEHL